MRVYLLAVKGKKGAPQRLPRNAGDADNFLKGIIDGIQHSGVLANDRCVIDARVRLVPCTTAAEERVEVELWQEDG